MLEEELEERWESGGQNQATSWILNACDNALPFPPFNRLATLATELELLLELELLELELELLLELLLGLLLGLLLELLKLLLLLLGLLMGGMVVWW
jgi:hypothetical protein